MSSSISSSIFFLLPFYSVFSWIPLILYQILKVFHTAGYLLIKDMTDKRMQKHVGFMKEHDKNKNNA